MLTPVERLVPDVEPTEDFLVYRVRSRSRKRWHICDMEARHGLGRCNCERMTLAGETDCYHLERVRKYQSVKGNQDMMEQRNAVNRR